MYLVDGYGFGVKLLLNLSGQDFSLHIHAPVGDHHQVAKQSHSPGQLALTRWFYSTLTCFRNLVGNTLPAPEYDLVSNALQVHGYP